MVVELHVCVVVCISSLMILFTSSKIKTDELFSTDEDIVPNRL